jgi:hypothetical protein
LNVKKKPKVIYEEQIYAAPMRAEHAIYFIASQWVTNMQEFKDACMPVIVFTWQNNNQEIWAMFHQSLQ